MKKIAKISKVHKVGGSLMVTLPSDFVNLHGIKEGDEVGILANHMLFVHPMKEGETPMVEQEIEKQLKSTVVQK